MTDAADPFSRESVVSITTLLNRDNVEDNLLIVQSLGGKRTAIGARLIGIDPGGATFEAYLSNGDEAAVVLPWESVPSTSDDVRGEVDRMYREACAKLGVPPRDGA